MAAVQIPNPPPTPNGDAWVELYRGEDHIFYESADGEASVDLSLKSDGKRRFLEWVSCTGCGPEPPKDQGGLGERSPCRATDVLPRERS